MTSEHLKDQKTHFVSGLPLVRQGLYPYAETQEEEGEREPWKRP